VESISGNCAKAEILNGKFLVATCLLTVKGLMGTSVLSSERWLGG
jgi:hypothetical protein